MTTVLVQHDVADYDAWRPLFDEHGAVRKEHGCTAERVYRAVDDDHAIAIVMQYPSPADAEGFMHDPSLADVMQRAGVRGEPRITIA